MLLAVTRRGIRSIETITTQQQQRLTHAASALRAGKTVVIVDDLAYAGTHHFAFSAEHASIENVCFLANQSRGVIVAAMWEQDLRELGLSPMGSSRLAGSHSGTIANLASQSAPDMMLSIDARHDTTTGISAHDRATTLRLLPHTENMRLDFVMPGHIFPLRAKAGGVLVRATIAEVSLDLLNSANETNTPSSAAVSRRPVIALGQILNEQGACATTEETQALAQKLKLPLVYFSDVIKTRLTSTSLVEKIADSRLPIRGAGVFRAIVFRSQADEAEHVALVIGDLSANVPTLVRVHAEHRLADTLGLGAAQRSIFGALKRIATEERGVFVYLRHPRKGFLRDQVLSLVSSKSPHTVMNLREHGVGVQILRALGVNKIRLLTNSQRDVPGLSAFDIEIIERVPFSIAEKSPLHSLNIRDLGI